MPEVWQDCNHLVLAAECRDQRNDRFASRQIVQKFQLVLYSRWRTGDVDLLDGYVFWRTSSVPL